MKAKSIGDCATSLWYEWAAEGLHGMSLLLMATSAQRIMGDVWLASQQMVDWGGW